MKQPLDEVEIAADRAAQSAQLEELRCPECGHADPLRIAYGYPTYEMFEASERSELALGGCVVDADSPSWRCRRCGREWGGPPTVIDGIAAFIP